MLRAEADAGRLDAELVKLMAESQQLPKDAATNRREP